MITNHCSWYSTHNFFTSKQTAICPLKNFHNVHPINLLLISNGIKTIWKANIIVYKDLSRNILCDIKINAKVVQLSHKTSHVKKCWNNFVRNDMKDNRWQTYHERAMSTHSALNEQTQQTAVTVTCDTVSDKPVTCDIVSDIRYSLLNTANSRQSVSISAQLHTALKVCVHLRTQQL